jgi:murein DD-endopeptidase MepM/ murein hydrolase activator NlpD
VTLKEISGKLWHQLMKKYRMVFIDHESLSHSRQWVVRPLGMILMSAAALGVMTFVTGALIVFTPVRELIPGYTDPDLKSDARELRALADTLEAKVRQQDEIIRSLSQIENFELRKPANYAEAPEYVPDSNQSSRDLPQPEDGAQSPDPQAEAAASSDHQTLQELLRKHKSREVMNLVPPVDGLITSKFNPSNPDDPHYGLDLVADENSLIRAVADGVVIFSEYSNQTGYVVGIAHTDYNLISFYKHNSRVFKKVGSHVFSGEAIAVIGNSGKNTSGTHLHFELWYENSPVNPEDYIIFK